MSKHVPRFGLLLLALTYVAFVSLGLPDGILGAAWPQLRAEFAVPLNANWPIYILGLCGGLISSLGSGALMRRMRTGNILLWTTVLTAGSMALCGLSPVFALIVTVAFLLGLGNGAVDATLNHHAATHLSSRHMNWLHGFWGVGVSLGTLLTSAVYAAGGDWRAACLTVAATQGAFALLFLAMLRAWEAPPEAGCIQKSTTSHAGTAGPRVRDTLRLPAAWVSMGSFFLYCGIEFGTGVWTTSLLQDGRGWHPDSAALCVSLFWGSLTAGRFGAGTVSNRLGSSRILSIALTGLLCGTGLLGISSLLPSGAGAGAATLAGLLLTGLSLAPIYPTLMHNTPAYVGQGHSINLIGMQAAAANVGLTFLPGLLGSFMRVTSINLLGWCLLAGACALGLLLRLRSRHADKPAH